MNPAYEKHTIIKFNTTDDLDFGSLELSDRKEDNKRMSSESLDDFTPLNSISTLNNDWIVKVRVTKIYPTWNFTNDKG